MAFAVFALLATPAHSGKLPLERLFAAPDLSGPTLRGVKISPDGKLVAYLQGARATTRIASICGPTTSRAARHRLLVDSRTLAGADRALSAEEEARRERQRTSAFSGIVEYSFAPDSRHLLIPLNGDLYVYDLARSGADAVRRLTTTDAYETDARFSPRSHYVSFIRDQNLYRHRSGQRHRTRHHARGRWPGELRHGRVHRAGGNGSRHRLLVVAGRTPHRAGARR